MSSETRNEQEVRSGLLSRFYLPQVISMFANVAIQPFPVIQIDFWAKSQRRRSLVFFISMTGLSFTEEDEFLSKICKSCNNLVREFRKFIRTCVCIPTKAREAIDLLE